MTYLPNREIKFKVWDNNSSLMFDWVDVQRWSMDTHTWDCYKFLQYTGLKDKNGVEIYEGDILSYDYADHTLNPYPEEKRKEPCYVVKYDSENSFHIGGFGIDKEMKLFAHAFRFKQTEVLGNIYQNADLLKTEVHP